MSLKEEMRSSKTRKRRMTRRKGTNWWRSPCQSVWVMAGGIRWVGDKRERERERVCVRQLTVLLTGPWQEGPPRPHDTETLCKTSHPPSDTQYMVFLLFDL